MHDVLPAPGTLDAAAFHPAVAEAILAERFEQEAVPHMRALYATACRMTRNPADAEDLVQDTYFRAFRAFSSFERGTNIRAWLFTILYRARADRYRRTQRSPQTVALLDDGPAVAPAQDAMARGQEDVMRALEQVPETFRTAVLLRDVQDFSYEEIAAITGVPAGTVMSRIHRGRARLRVLLERVK